MSKYIFYETKSNGPMRYCEICESPEDSEIKSVLYSVGAPSGVKYKIVDMDLTPISFIGDKPYNPLVWEDYEKLWSHIFSDGYSIL